MFHIPTRSTFWLSPMKHAVERCHGVGLHFFSWSVPGESDAVYSVFCRVPHSTSLLWWLRPEQLWWTGLVAYHHYDLSFLQCQPWEMLQSFFVVQPFTWTSSTVVGNTFSSHVTRRPEEDCFRKGRDEHTSRRRDCWSSLYSCGTHLSSFSPFDFSSNAVLRLCGQRKAF